MTDRPESDVESRETAQRGAAPPDAPPTASARAAIEWGAPAAKRRPNAQMAYMVVGAFGSMAVSSVLEWLRSLREYGSEIALETAGFHLMPLATLLLVAGFALRKAPRPRRWWAWIALGVAFFGVLSVVAHFTTDP